MQGLTRWILSQKWVPDYVSNSLLQGGRLPTWLSLVYRGCFSDLV